MKTNTNLKKQIINTTTLVKTIVGTSICASLLYGISKHPPTIKPIYAIDMNKDCIEDYLFFRDSWMEGYQNVCYIDGKDISREDGKIIGWGHELSGFMIRKYPEASYRYSVRDVDSDSTLDLVVTRTDLGIAIQPADTFYNIVKSIR